MPDQKVLTMIEEIVEDMLKAFDVQHPPIPVELMLQRPHEGLWSEVDLSDMSATFLNMRDRYAPRMSVVRLLARTVIRSVWGNARDPEALLLESPFSGMFARAIIVPRRFLDDAEPDTLSPVVLSELFEVPEEDIRLRLSDLGYYEE